MPEKTAPPALMWFRRDLRLNDNPALAAAIATGNPLVLVYILEEDLKVGRARGGASQWWLDKSLTSLSSDIEALGGKLILRRGNPQNVLNALIDETGATQIYWNRRYSQPEQDNDAQLKSALKVRGLQVHSFNGSLLTEPWTQKTGHGGYYKVYSPYWRSVEANYDAPPPAPRPEQLTTLNLPSDHLTSWALHPRAPDWSKGFQSHWTPGETGARQRLEAFLAAPVNTYKNDRNRPDLRAGTSGLSPHLAFGEIGPAQVWRATQILISGNHVEEKNATVFLKEIVWREFSYVLLYHNPDLAKQNYNPGFAFMPWRNDPEAYKKWCHGQTGYPMVDAGMRQLWQIGWIHNRARMIVASFLTKHLLLPWQLGEDWFWDTLVDADPASNAASWQWTAGSGADAAPYFRVFNPITQGPKFDETGDYVRTYCPELASLPTQYIHRPWEAPALVLAAAGVTIGKTYPAPMVDHKEARERALEAYNTLKAAKDDHT